MLALNNIFGAVAIGIAYGYVAGTCMFHIAVSVISGTNDPRHLAVDSTGGYFDARLVGARVSFIITQIIVWPIISTLLYRARMGICFTFTGVYPSALFRNC